MLGFDLSTTGKYKRFQTDFIDLGKIGSGGFAKVHRVKSRIDHSQYGLKMIEIKPSNCKQDMIDTIYKYLSQVKILSNLNHKNIIQYYGCWIQSQQNIISTQIPTPSTQSIKNSFNIQRRQSLNKYSSIHKINIEQKQKQKQQQQVYQMIVEDNFSSGGIQFALSENDNQIYQENNNNHYEIEINHKQKQIKKQINYDHSQASEEIRAKYKIIKIYILSELCQGNVQTYLYKRNMQKKKNNHDNHNNNHIISNHHNIHAITIKTNPIQKDQLIQSYKMIIQIIQGLQYLHSKCIIHRDIKLHNIVYDKNKNCKIIDYGLAKKARMLNSISQSHPRQFRLDDQYNRIASSSYSNNNIIQQTFSSSVGTKIYSSPQQITSERYDHRTDIYSLAIVILMFFCDFTTTHQELIIIEKIRKIDIKMIKCDQRLKGILIKCLGEQKNRPRLKQIKKIVKVLLRQRYQRQYKNINNNNHVQKENIIQKQQNLYIFQNDKLKKKISKQQYLAQNQKKLKKSCQSTRSSLQSLEKKD